MAKRIHFKSGYKYQLQYDYMEHLPIQPLHPIKTNFIRLDQCGNLVILKGYAWDGVSGGAPDLNAMMRASLKHDALYQLIAQGLLDIKWREVADNIFLQDCKIDGLWPWFAQAAYNAVRLFGKKYVLPDSRKTIKRAPTN